MFRESVLFFCSICLFGGYEWRRTTEHHITWLKTVCSLTQPSLNRAVPHVHTVPPSHTAVSSGCEEHWMQWSLRWSRTAQSDGWRGKGIIVAGSEKGAQDGHWEGNWVFGRINNPDVGLLSHCNRAKILIKLCILTVIAEHFCVFECVRVFIPVCMRGCVCTDVSFFPHVQCTYIGPTVHMHNFLLSFTQRAHSFLHTTLIQTTLCLKTDQARPVPHLCCSLAISPIY